MNVLAMSLRYLLVKQFLEIHSQLIIEADSIYCQETQRTLDIAIEPVLTPYSAVVIFLWNELSVGLFKLFI